MSEPQRDETQLAEYLEVITERVLLGEVSTDRLIDEYPQLAGQIRDLILGKH